MACSKQAAVAVCRSVAARCGTGQARAACRPGHRGPACPSGRRQASFLGPRASRPSSCGPTGTRAAGRPGPRRISSSPVLAAWPRPQPRLIRSASNQASGSADEAGRRAAPAVLQPAGRRTMDHVRAVRLGRGSRPRSASASQPPDAPGQAICPTCLGILDGGPFAGVDPQQVVEAVAGGAGGVLRGQSRSWASASSSTSSSAWPVADPEQRAGQPGGEVGRRPACPAAETPVAARSGRAR